MQVGVGGIRRLVHDIVVVVGLYAAESVPVLSSTSPACHTLAVPAGLLSPSTLATRIQAIATTSGGSAIVTRRVASLSSLGQWLVAMNSVMMPRQEVAALKVDMAKMARVIAT